MMYWANHMSTGGWISSILATLIIVAIIIGLIVWIVSPASRSGSPTTTGESVREILDRRLASGEITVEQYSQLREVLGDAPLAASDTRSRDPASIPG